MYNNLNDNIIKMPEDNWSLVSNDTDIWPGELPYKIGDKFPTESIKERASISKTNKLIYENDTDQIYSNIISIFPEIDPTYGWQIREIVTNLPYFKNSVNSWVGLVAGDVPLVDSDETNDEALSSIIDRSNFAEFFQDEVHSRFIDTISAYRVDIDLNGDPVIVKIDTKNIVVFVNKDKPYDIEVTLVFSIYTDKNGRDLIDFVEYHYDGLIRKHTMFYSNGTIGDYVKPVEESLAFGGKFKTSPIVVFTHNTIGGQIYGTDQFRYWYPSMLAGMREFQNVLRLGERTREMIRKVPNSAIKKNPVDGSSTFMNRGTIGYTEGTDGGSPDIEYIVPKINMQEALNSLEKAVNQIAIDTQLGYAFFNLDKLGSNLSADSIRATLLPARLEAKRITTEMKNPIRKLIKKLGMLGGLDINMNKLNIEFFDGFPRDDINDIRGIQLRLESNTPSISLEDAIMKLDRIPLRVARQKVKEILAERSLIGNSNNKLNSKDTLENVETEKIEKLENSEYIPGSDLNASADSNKHKENKTSGNYEDDTVWDSEIITKPRDIPQGVSTNNE